MADVTGRIKTIAPANGAYLATGSEDNLKANAQVNIPALSGAYKTTVRLSIYRYETCVLNSNISSASNTYPVKGFPQSVETSDASSTVTAAGGYLATATLVAKQLTPMETLGLKSN